MPSATPDIPTPDCLTESSAARRSQLAAALARATAGWELLSHSFYQRWQSGELSLHELSRYAVQYRAFESALPQVLTDIVTGIGEIHRSGASDAVRRNLRDELGNPAPHLELFDRFAAALPDAIDDRLTPSTLDLVDTYRELATRDPIRALSALAAYETQASAIASTKGAGLRKWYGINDAGREFWDVHADMEADHGDWAVDALTLLEADPSDVEESARQGADLWWSFLDERQSENELMGAT